MLSLLRILLARCGQFLRSKVFGVWSEIELCHTYLVLQCDQRNVSAYPSVQTSKSNFQGEGEGLDRLSLSNPRRAPVVLPSLQVGQKFT